MDKYLITVDGGTTNTRVYLWNEKKKLISSAKREIGVRDTAIDGNNSALKRAVKEMIEAVLKQAEITADDVKEVYVSGMLTSNAGLFELSHLTVPAGGEDFARGVKRIFLPEIYPNRLTFIPGLKNMEDSEVCLSHILDMDMMRGEEMEALALLHTIPKENPTILVLPGSHTKVVIADKDKKIRGCLTCMTGEMLQILTEHSLLAEATGKEYLKGEPDQKYLLAGFQAVRESGSLTRAGFVTRIVNTFVTKDKEKIKSFLLGSVLENDIAAILSSNMMKGMKDVRVLIAGKEPLASSLKLLMETCGSFKQVEVYHSEDDLPLSGKGAWMIHDLIGDYKEYKDLV